MTDVFDVIQELLEHLRTDGVKLAVADGRANVILKDGAIGADSILVRVDTHIVGEPLREKLRDRLLRWFDVAAVDFERDKSTSIGCLGFWRVAPPGTSLRLWVSLPISMV